MAIETVKQLCTPNAVVTSDSLVEQVAQIEDFATPRVDGREFFRRNHFTDGLDRLVKRGFDRLAGRSEDGAFYLTQAMGGGKTHSLIAFGLLAPTRTSPRGCPDDRGGQRLRRGEGGHLQWPPEPRQPPVGLSGGAAGHGDVMAPFWRNGAKTPGVDEWVQVLGSSRF